VVADVRRARGPLGGIETALRHTNADWNLIVACDMPGLSAPFLAGLIEEAAREDCDCLLPAVGAGLPEPLCGVWHRRSLAAISGALDRNVLKISRAIEPLRVVHRQVAASDWAANMNTPAEWQAHLASGRR
jgi:molybdopterin-guanine dinucleotide biosynthesis protein A